MLPNNDGIDSKPRTIKLVISDDGKTQFNFSIEGDIERIGKIPTSEYSAAEFWATQFFALCQDQLEHHGEIGKIENENPQSNVKSLNRKERRAQR